jgi:hypothetical protein
LSDKSRRRSGTSGRTKQRSKSTPRGGRHGLTRSAVTVRAEPPTREETAAGVPTRARRQPAMSATPAVEMTREQEFAYIRSDMRRLIIIAAALLALMLVLLFVVNR